MKQLFNTKPFNDLRGTEGFHQMKMCIRFFLPVLFLALTSCQTDQPEQPATPEAGLFKVAIFYPNGADKSFDMDYYEHKHMPMVASLLEENLELYEIDKGLSGRTPEDDIPYVAIGYFYVKDIAAYNETIRQHRDMIVGDFKNYTNIQPVIQINEIVYSGRHGNKE